MTCQYCGESHEPERGLSYDGIGISSCDKYRTRVALVPRRTEEPPPDVISDRGRQLLARDMVTAFNKSLQRHEGWTNRETWAIAFYIDNDASKLAMALEVASVAPDRLAIADELEASFADEDSIDQIRQPYAALVQCALGRINWQELAAHYERKSKEGTTA